jgi:hypothetical protein
MKEALAHWGLLCHKKTMHMVLRQLRPKFFSALLIQG